MFSPRVRSFARDLGHDYIGTEHLLLAQFTEPAGWPPSS